MWFRCIKIALYIWGVIGLAILASLVGINHYATSHKWIAEAEYSQISAPPQEKLQALKP